MSGAFSPAFSSAFDTVAVTRSGCPWPIDPAMCCAGVDIDPDDPRVVSVIAQVSVMMTRWSGFLYGGCRTVRPLAPCGECRAGCCSSGDCIVLHEATAVTEVRVRGAVVDPADYHFDPARGVLCAVPPLVWPSGDPRYLNEGEMEVDTLVGAPPDEWALAVAAELACELIKSCTDTKGCRLPRNATQVSTLGVTVQMSDEQLKYALPAVSAWVQTVNPAGAVLPSRIYSPEADRARTMGRVRAGRWRGYRPWL